MFKVCAIMSVFNEEDIILESVMKLINGGLDVYVINNGCTDSTITKIQHLVGNGVIDILNYETEENGKRVFKLSSILEKIQNIAKELDYDWFLHVDADEIRYSPWRELSLYEGIERVDYEGFNLINFKLYNFRTTENYEYLIDYENSMQYYTEIDEHSSIQIKCWKKNEKINLKVYGGHIAQRDNSQLYPLQFIHKHYPIRGVAHGIRKLNGERLGRYSLEEIERGWHRHYQEVDFNSLKGIVWEYESLKKFSLEEELLKIHSENNKKMISLIRLQYYLANEEIERGIVKMICDEFALSTEEATSRLAIAKIIMENNFQGKMEKIQSTKLDELIFKKIFYVYANKFYLVAKPLHEKLINKIELNC